MQSEFKMKNRECCCYCLFISMQRSDYLRITSKLSPTLRILLSTERFPFLDNTDPSFINAFLALVSILFLLLKHKTHHTYHQYSHEIYFVKLKSNKS